ncbi:hypothetical protein KY289_019442 [Solanum tuberosum]|nr:hypothetical protein KY289_019442 [Solanum tuberosum]
MAISSKLAEPNKHLGAFICIPDDQVFLAVVTHGGKILSSAELYNLETGTWKTLPSMNERPRARGDTPATSEAPLLVAVVNSYLYAIDYANMEVRKYDKQIKAWATIRRLPERAASMDDWGLAFRACGDRLILIGEPIAMGRVGTSEVNSSVPSVGRLQWNLL